MLWSKDSFWLGRDCECWERAGVAPAPPGLDGGSSGESRAHFTHWWVLGRLPGGRKWRKGIQAEKLEPGVPDKCGGAEQAGPQDLDKTDGIRSNRDVPSGRVTGSHSSNLRLVKK